MARRGRPASGPLDARAQAILRAVIEEYVVTATPSARTPWSSGIGSAVSSATVRDILADLEAAGLLTHPHTSAGRIPTDRGYRFYVEALADSDAAAAGRAADDPAPVRAGPVRQRSLVPPRRDDPRHDDRCGRAGDRREARGDPPAPARPRRPGSARQLHPGPPRGHHQAGSAEPPSAGRPGRADPRREPSERRARRPDRERHRGPGAGLLRGGGPTGRRRRLGRGPRVRSRRAGRRADRPHDARVRCRLDRGGLQRRPPQRDGGSRVRPEREAPTGLLALENRAYLGDLLGTMAAAAASTCSSATRTRPPTCATCRSCSLATVDPAGRSVSSASSGRPGWPIPMRSALSGSSPG